MNLVEFLVESAALKKNKKNKKASSTHTEYHRASLEFIKLSNRLIIPQKTA